MTQYDASCYRSTIVKNARAWRFAVGVLVACWSVGIEMGTANAQTTTKPATQKPATEKPAAAKPAVAKPAVKAPGTKTPPAAKPAAPATQSAGKIAEPATPEQAAKVLDLRTFPVMQGAKVSDLRALGMLMYEAKGTPKAAFEFQQAELLKRGFKELPGGYRDAMTNTGNFVKDGFHVAVSSSDSGAADPTKKGFSYVNLKNDGNVAVEKLPVPPGVKPFYPQAYRAAYTTDKKVPETAAECRKLLLAAGWEPYGEDQPNANLPDSATQYFKRNAIQLKSWVMVTPADGGKTLIQYSTDLLSVDLPIPPGTVNPQYTDSQKTLRFDSPNDQTDAIVAFYQERLPKLGWKATTERPIKDDRDKSQFVIYRNAQMDLLSLDLKQYTDIVRVKLTHQTAAEVAEEERLAKAHAALKKAELDRKNMKVKVSVPLPAKTKKVEKDTPSRFEFTMATGEGAAALEEFRKYFIKQGWTEEKGAELAKEIGNIAFKKGEADLSFRYFDVGFGDVEITVSGSSNVEFETETDKVEKAKEEPKTAKKKPAIPGLPDLPPGVELPDDVNDLLKKALEEAEKKPAAPKKP